MTTDILVPKIGDFRDVPVIEILVAPGDRVEEGAPILMLESDKATLDIPAPFTGTVRELLVAVGTRVSAGTPVLRMAADAAPLQGVDTAAGGSAAEPAHASVPPPSAHGAPFPAVEGTEADLVVIGGGPGGYTAAFRAADLGRAVTLIEPRDTLGGVCLNVGCIPSKALLHVARLCDEARDAEALGLKFGPPQVDLASVRAFRDGVIGRLTSGLAGLAKRRKVTVIRGHARFTGPHSLNVSSTEGTAPLDLRFRQAIIATGSEPIRLPFLPEDPRILDSTGALALETVPDRLLVIGGGIIGLEMAQVYLALGARVEIVEQAGQIIPGADADLVVPLTRRIKERCAALRLATRVSAVEACKSLLVTFEGPKGQEEAEYDRILVAIGRRPNGAACAPEAAGIALEGPGFIPVNDRMQTVQPHIFAIGDVVGQPMLAHKATHEGKVAAEVACGHQVAFEPASIPSVAYTDPEVAWVGLTEAQAKAEGRKVGKGAFPWAASGRALSLGRSDGLTKLMFDPATGRLLGAGITGPSAGELIAEAALAIEMGADAQDMGLTIHPHPTLSETLGLAAEAFSGTLTDL